MTRRRKAFLTAIALGAALDAGYDQLRAQSSVADSVRARAIVERYIQALGGKAALEPPKNLYAVLSMTMSTSPGVMRMETWRQPPKLLTRQQVAGMGATEFGFDGTTGWMTSPLLGTTLLGEIPKVILGLEDVSSALHQQPMSYLGKRTVEGKVYEAVFIRPKGSLSYTAYFEPHSGLLAGMKLENTGADPPMDVVFGDYKRFGSVLRATRTTTRLAGGNNMVTLVESLSTAPIDAKVFELPPKVRELRKRKP